MGDAQTPNHAQYDHEAMVYADDGNAEKQNAVVTGDEGNAERKNAVETGDDQNAERSSAVENGDNHSVERQIADAKIDYPGVEVYNTVANQHNAIASHECT